MDKLKLAEQALVKEDVPNFRTGDRVNVHYRVSEGNKERIQKFEGDVISRQGSGANKTFIVRKISAGNIGVERIFPLNSPFIAKIEVTRKGDVRRSKLYYLRDRSGKSARIKEKDEREAELGKLGQEADAAAEEKPEEIQEEVTDQAVAEQAEDETSEDTRAEEADKEETAEDQDKTVEATADDGDEAEEEKKKVASSEEE